MEEDIWEIENNIDMFMDTLYENYKQSAVKPFEKAIENLIARNKELEEKYIDLYNKKINIPLQNVIPKSKIKEKIEELDRRIFGQSTIYYNRLTVGECLFIKRFLEREFLGED